MMLMFSLVAVRQRAFTRSSRKRGMADVHPLSPKTKARLDDEASSLDDETLVRTSKGAICPCEHNARVLIAHAPQYVEPALRRVSIADAHRRAGLDRRRRAGKPCAGCSPRTASHALRCNTHAAAREWSPIPGAGTPCASSSKGYARGMERHASSPPSTMPGAHATMR